MDAPSLSAAGLRPLTAGELIDRSVVFWRAHLGPLFRLYLALQLVGYALGKLGLGPFYRALALYQTEVAARPAASWERLVDLSPALRGLALVIAFIWWLSWLGVVAGTHFTVRRLLGESVPLSAALRKMLGRAGAVTLALVISSVWGAVVSVLSVIPGTLVLFLGIQVGGLSLLLLAFFGVSLMLLGLLVTFVWWVLRFMLVAPVLAEEEGGVWFALQRSGALMRGRIGPGFFGWVKVRASVLLSGVSAMLVAISVIGGVPAFFLQVKYGGLFRPGGPTPDAIPALLLIPAELLQQGVHSFFAPLSMALAAFFYVDLRVRREGLDLEARVASLAGP
jgi:hypothetical protein